MQVVLRKLSYKNQLVLPAPLLAELQIKPADILAISMEDKTIKIKKTKGLEEFYGSFATGKRHSIEEFKNIAKKRFAQRRNFQQ